MRHASRLIRTVVRGLKERILLNNNNRGNNSNNNNRRRGRGNNRPQGGGQQLNRIDSRARGNAPQMLEKYRKLAHDAHLNGDRVQEETYLQFADHYFRVISDARVRQEEPRTPRAPGERWQEGSEGEREDGENSGDFAEDGEYSSYDRPQYNRVERPERAERPERTERPRDDRPREDRQRDNRQRSDARSEAPAGDAAAPEPAAKADEAAAETAFEPQENPFVRDNREVRGTRGLRPRRDDHRPARPAADDSQPGELPLGLDPSMLPPAISVAPAIVDAGDADDAVPAAKPAPRRRAPRARPPADDAGEALEVVG